MVTDATKEMSCMQCITRGPWRRKLRMLLNQVHFGSCVARREEGAQGGSNCMSKSLEITHDDDHTAASNRKFGYQAHSAALTNGPDLVLQSITSSS